MYNLQVQFETRQYCIMRGGSQMTEVKVRENESLDNALKRFKRQCAITGVLSEVRKREHYEKPSVKRKKKAEAAKRKKNKKIAK